MSSYEKHNIRCSYCRGEIVDVRTDGRRSRFNSYWFDVPNSFPIPTCAGCNRKYLSREAADKLDLIGKRLILKRKILLTLYCAFGAGWAYGLMLYPKIELYLAGAVFSLGFYFWSEYQRG